MSPSHPKSLAFAKLVADASVETGVEGARALANLPTVGAAGPGPIIANRLSTSQLAPSPLSSGGLHALK